ncbi:MAG TPA: sugar phosphate isomerase/epimerase [Candidatus Bathyarchaeia archaeon]|nr:sugar phosphate isomerase/epimerase [Candidatus Bathyarchaeia archaeon]
MKPLLVTTAATLILATGVSFAQPAGTPNAEKLGWRLACQAYSFNHFTFFEAVDKTAATGCKYIEAYPGQKLSPEKPDVVFNHNAPQDVLDAVKAKLAAAGVTLVNYGVVELTANEAEDRKVFDFAKKMGIETIVSEPAPGDMDTVQKLVKEYGIPVAIHNHPKPTKYWDPARVLAAVEGRQGIGSCADTGHWMRSGVNPLQALQMLNGKIVSFHLKDLNEASKDAHDVVWGTGKADVKALLAEMKKQGFKGVFSIEYEYNWDNSVPDITQCVAAFDQFAAELQK